MSENAPNEGGEQKPEEQQQQQQPSESNPSSTNNEASSSSATQKPEETGTTSPSSSEQQQKQQSPSESKEEEQTTTAATATEPGAAEKETENENESATATASKPIDETVEQLQRDIHRLEESIRDKSRALQDKRKLVAGLELTVETAQDAANEADRALAAAQEELRAAERERASLLPQYERCQQNQDQREKAEQYKKEIVAAEQTLRERDSIIKDLEVNLQDVSAAYKTERERKSIAINRVKHMVAELQRAVERKVTMTLPIDDAEGAPNASECLRCLDEITRERELAIAQWSRHGRELAATIAMKQQRALELQLESERLIETTKAAKDEEIRSMVMKFQQERESLQKDIEDVKSANEDHRMKLRNTKLMSEQARAANLQDDSAFGASPAPHASRRDFATPSEKLLAGKAGDLEKEKAALLDRVRKASLERQRIIKATKELRKCIEQDQEAHQAGIRSIEGQVARKRQECAELEAENSRLEEACVTLTSTLKLTVPPNLDH